MKQTSWTFCLLRRRTWSAGFQTCRIADPPKSAGREAAPEAGLEICAAIGRAQRDLLSSDFELVIRGFLPPLNFTCETRNH